MDAALIALLLAAVWQPLLGRSVAVTAMVILIVPLWTELLRYFGIYDSHRLHGFNLFVRQIGSAHLLGAALLIPTSYAVAGGEGVARAAAFSAISALSMIVQKGALRVALATLRRRGLDQRSVLVIGGWEAAQQTAAEFARHPEWGLHVSLVGVGEPESRNYWNFSTRELVSTEAEEALRRTVIDEVWVVVPFGQIADERPTMALCRDLGLLGRLLVFSPVGDLSQAEISDFNGRLSIGVGGLGHGRAAMALKRLTDIFVGSLMLIMAAPVMLVAAVLVKLSSPGPVLYSQMRVGLRGRQFRMYKFRTMVDGADTIPAAMRDRSITRGPMYKHPKDWRITPTGRMLRKFSIDELPQIWHVIRGEMSLVGPRPLPVHEAEAISGTHRKRFSMRPGLTCLWQVNGRSNIDFAQWMRFDIEYVEQWSLWLDARLMLKTVPVVLTGKGAF
jgi:exopolysaccharide biosynthesis polyprenyl glycosylphosphotransferase